MDDIIQAANEILDRLETQGFSGWQQDAILDTAKLIASIKLRTEIDAMPALVVPSE